MRVFGYGNHAVELQAYWSPAWRLDTIRTIHSYKMGSKDG